MNLHPSDITRLVSRGVGPNHPNFAGELLRTQRQRKEREEEDLHRRIESQTKGRGMNLEAHWDNPRKWLTDTKARCPMWLGATVRIEVWGRGEGLKHVALISAAGNPNKSSLFETSADFQTWRRIL